MEGLSLQSLEEEAKTQPGSNIFYPSLVPNLISITARSTSHRILLAQSYTRAAGEEPCGSCAAQPFLMQALSHRLTSPSCPGAGTARLELRSSLPVAPALVSSWRRRFWRRLLQAVLVDVGVRGDPAGWLPFGRQRTQAGAQRPAAGTCVAQPSCCVSTLITEKETSFFLSADVTPDSYSLEGEQ